MRILFIILISFLFTKSFSVNSQVLEAVDVTSEGNRYIGEVLNGQRHGKGTLVESTGLRYEGEWRNNQMHGKGVLTNSDGDRYEGEMKNNHFHGKGKLVLQKDGSTYYGEFLKSKMHGMGVLFLNDGRMLKGEFKHGSYVEVPINTKNELAQDQNIKEKANVKRKKGENRGKFGYTFQMNAMDIKKKCNYEWNRENYGDYLHLRMSNCPGLDRSFGFGFSFFNKNGNFIEHNNSNLYDILLKQGRQTGEFLNSEALLTSISKDLGDATFTSWKKLINTLNSKYKLLRSPSSEEKEKYRRGGVRLKYFFENTKNPNEPKYIVAVQYQSEYNYNSYMMIEYLSEFKFQDEMKRLNKEDSKFDDL